MLILASGPDGGYDINYNNDDLRDVKGGILVEVHIGKYKVPVDSVGHHDPPASKCGEMVTFAMHGFVICPWTHLWVNIIMFSKSVLPVLT